VVGEGFTEFACVEVDVWMKERGAGFTISIDVESLHFESRVSMRPFCLELNSGAC